MYYDMSYKPYWDSPGHVIHAFGLQAGGKRVDDFIEKRKTAMITFDGHKSFVERD